MGGIAIALVPAIVCLLNAADARVYHTTDAVVIEVRPESAISLPVAAVPASPSSRSCWTHDGKLGVCGTVRSCYPNTRLPELSNLETWVIGTRGTCFYVEPSGRQVYGMCCERQTAKEPAPEVTTQPPVTTSTNNPSIPTVPVDPATGIPLPGFPWWEFYPWKPLIVNGTNSTSSVPKPQVQAVVSEPKSACGAGPFKTLSTDEQKRIVGGQDAVKNSWPCIVALLNNGRQFCGGSLIDSNHILTAAHCVAHMSSWDVARLQVALGMHTLKPKMDPQVTKKVRRVTRHRGFDSKTLYNDIAILTLESSVDFTSSISPCCLPDSGSTNLYTDKDAAVIGWGAIREGGGQPQVLQQVTVQILSNDKCKSMYGSDAPGGIVDHMLCAAYPNKDSCSGDSGGPLLVQDSAGSPWVQAGIVSWGIGCAQARYPGVYARVTSFLGWIAKNL